MVDTDQSEGARAAVQHLIDLGHDTVWHLAGPEGSFAAQRRADAWRAVLEKADRTVHPVVRGDWSSESGYRAGLLLADRPDFTAVFAANDQMALGLDEPSPDLSQDAPAFRPGRNWSLARSGEAAECSSQVLT